MINEIPRLTRAKYELATKEPFTPIKQDVKKGELRYFKYGEMPFNYGALPQTWEDCNEKHPLTGYVGDNDPIDAVELSDEPIEVGKVVRVRVLGIFALIDEGETDWKLIVIQESHPLFDKIHSIADVEKYIGGETIKKVRDWFQYYKTADGKAENQFAMNGDILDAKMAEKIIEETHHSWQKLVKKLVRNESGLWVPSNVQQQSAL